MDLKEEVTRIREQGMERAASIWETLENLPQPVEAVNVFKAACSIKCAEFMTRVHNNPVFPVIMKSLVQFMDGTLSVVENVAGSDSSNGMRVVAVLEEAMPLTAEIFADAAAYATRQHVYDGLIMLAAAKMGKEQETKACIDRLQGGVAKAMLLSMFAESLASKDDDTENPMVAGWVEPKDE
jgi:hypothetical protein